MLDFVHAQHQKGGLRRLHLACNCKKFILVIHSIWEKRHFK